ncbi:PDZ domain-containing protein [bacterium]|nr:PDZ domain-containing protein [bacterium]
MKNVGLTVLALFIGVSLSLANCAYAEQPQVVIIGQDEDVNSEKAFLGIYMSDVSEEIIKDMEYPYDKGVLIMEVIDDSPAQEAGLRDDDIIYIFDGNKIDDTKDLSRLVKGKTPGDRVEVVFFRKGDRKRVNVNLTGKKQDSYTVQYDWDEYADKMGEMGKHVGRSIGGVIDKYFGAYGIEGLALSDLDEDMARYFNFDKNKGVLVTGVSGKTAAKKAGVKSGDITIEVNGKEIGSVEDYNEALKDCDEEFKLVVVRKGEKIEFNFKPEDIEKHKHFGLPERKIYKIEIPGGNKTFDIITKERIGLDNKFKELKPLHKELVILKEETEKSLEKNLKDIENRMKDIEKRLKELEEKRN